ncbi:MAG: lysylphosphatidylglycerol synthase transmembrane domain-containing protein [Candidatus Hydrothermia bacterium]
MKKLMSNFLKVLISTLLLYLIFKRINAHELIRSIKGANLPLLIPGYFLYMLAIFLSAVRWKIFLNHSQVNISNFEAFKYYLIAIFAGNFLPSGGLDVVRAYYAGRKSSVSRCLAVTLMDRLVGFYAILFYLILTLFFLTISQKELFLFTLVGITLILLGNIFVFSNLFAKAIGKIKPNKITKPIISFLWTLHNFKDNYPLLFKTLPISILIQLLFSLTPWALAFSIHIKLPLKETILLLPIVNFVMMIPITISGLGLREGAFVLIYGNTIGNENSLLISLLYYSASLLLSLVGMVLFLLDKPQKDLKKLNQ